MGFTILGQFLLPCLKGEAMANFFRAVLGPSMGITILGYLFCTQFEGGNYVPFFSRLFRGHPWGLPSWGIRFVPNFQGETMSNFFPGCSGAIHGKYLLTAHLYSFEGEGYAIFVRGCVSMQCNAMQCHAMPCHMPCHAHVVPCHAMPCYVMPCHVMPCHAMPCLAMPCHAIPCPCSAMPCVSMACHAS